MPDKLCIDERLEKMTGTGLSAHGFQEIASAEVGEANLNAGFFCTVSDRIRKPTARQLTMGAGRKRARKQAASNCPIFYARVLVFD